MIETALVFIRNCVMAVLTAWAGIHIIEQATRPKAEPAQASLIRTGDTDSACPHKAAPADASPSSSAAIGQEGARPDGAERVQTIR